MVSFDNKIQIDSLFEKLWSASETTLTFFKRWLTEVDSSEYIWNDRSITLADVLEWITGTSLIPTERILLRLNNLLDPPSFVHSHTCHNSLEFPRDSIVLMSTESDEDYQTFKNMVDSSIGSFLLSGGMYFGRA